MGQDEPFDPLALLNQNEEKLESIAKENELKDTVDALAKPEVELEDDRLTKTSEQIRLDELHTALAEAADGRTEDMIGLSDPYWTRRNELQAYLHSLKA